MPDYILHKIKKGETISQLAKRYNLEQHKIVQANPDKVKLKKVNNKYEPFIYEGDIIKIPQKEEVQTYIVISNPSLGMGKEETFELLTKEGKIPSLTSDKIEWEFSVNEGSNRWRKLILEKKKTGQKITITFYNQKLKGKKLKVIPYYTPEKKPLATDIAKLEGQDKSQIHKVELLDINRNKISRTISYGETIYARVQCIGMDGETLQFSLWECNKQDNKENFITSAKVDIKYGIAEVSFSMNYAMVFNNKNKYLEYYVTVSSLGYTRKSGNMKVDNPDYIPPKPKNPGKKETPAKKTPQTTKQTESAKNDILAIATGVVQQAIKIRANTTNIEKVFFTDNFGKILAKKPKYGDTIRVYIQGTNLKDKNVRLELWEDDRVYGKAGSGKYDDLLLSEVFALTSSTNNYKSIKLTGQMQQKGDDALEGSQQELYARVTIFKTGQTATSELIIVDTNDFFTPQPEGVKVVTIDVPEKKQENECVCRDLIWGNKLTCEERKKVIQVCSNIWGDNQKMEKANMLMAVIHLETVGTFSPSKENGKGYVGLIQFHSSTANSLGTTYEALKNMTFIQQMDYVEKYLRQNKDKMKTLVDFYLQVLKPNAVGQGSNPNYVVFDESIPVPDGDGSNTSLDQRIKNINREPWVTKYGYSSNPPFMKEEGERSKRKKWVYTRQRYEDRWGHHNGKTYIWEVEKEIKPKHYDTGIPEKYTGTCVKGKKKEEKKEKGERAPWMKIAWGQEVKKLVETGSNKEIQKFFKGTAYEKIIGTIDKKTKQPINEKTVSWCASFVNWVMVKYGYKGITTDGGYYATRALKWAKWPEGKDLGKPVYGAIAVKRRKGGGHVGFVAGKQGSSIIILGGNQGDKLQCSTYNVSDFFAYVIPNDYEITEKDYNLPEYKGSPAEKGSES